MSMSFFVTLGVTLAFIVTLAFSIWSSVTIIREGNIELLLVFGKAEAVLEPGLNIVPPFVSSSYPIDVRTMQYETSTGSEPIPPAYHDEIRDAAVGHIPAE